MSRHNALCVDPLVGHELWAETYDKGPNPLLALEERELSKLLLGLEGLFVADVACGTGRWMRRALAMKAGDVVGIDFSPSMLREAARKPRLAGRLVLAQADRIPLKSSSADIVICAFSLGYFEKLEAVSIEFCRVLRPGGSLFCSDVHPSAHRRGWKRSFQGSDRQIEVRNIAREADEIANAFGKHFQLEKKLDFSLGEAERPIFERAGKLDRLACVEAVPAVIVFHWRKVALLCAGAEAIVGTG